MTPTLSLSRAVVIYCHCYQRHQNDYYHRQFIDWALSCRELWNLTRMFPSPPQDSLERGPLESALRGYGN